VRQDEDNKWKPVATSKEGSEDNHIIEQQVLSAKHIWGTRKFVLQITSFLSWWDLLEGCDFCEVFIHFFAFFPIQLMALGTFGTGSWGEGLRREAEQESLSKRDSGCSPFLPKFPGPPDACSSPSHSADSS
jgi:hypothetical protein